MKYAKVEEARFLRRPNRFLAQVERMGQEETVHVKNTGRCRELLVPGAKVYLEDCGNPARKTRYDLIAVEKGDRLINMDSQAPNQAAGEWLRAGGIFPPGGIVRPEYRYKESRFDFYLEAGERKGFVEVKGVTLEQNGIVSFPDAPTARGTRHLRELRESLEQGYEAYLLFVVQMANVRMFCPNEATDPLFAGALREAAKAGVKILAMECQVSPSEMVLSKEIPILL